MKTPRQPRGRNQEGIPVPPADGAGVLPGAIYYVPEGYKLSTDGQFYVTDEPVPSEFWRKVRIVAFDVWVWGSWFYLGLVVGRWLG